MGRARACPKRLDIHYGRAPLQDVAGGSAAASWMAVRPQSNDLEADSPHVSAAPSQPRPEMSSTPPPLGRAA